MNSRIVLISQKQENLPKEVIAFAPNQTILACDFYINGAESGKEVPGGYKIGSIVNIDHHAPTQKMARKISSANLAIERVKSLGPDTDSAILINHTDCDSILSSAIMAGEIEPDPKFGEAAIAADHTGEENPIADLLQALDEDRKVPLSLRNLRLLLNNEPLDAHAQRRLEARQASRAAAKGLVENGKYERLGPVVYFIGTEAIDGEFFPALLPDAEIILVASRRPGEPRWNMKVRLGLAAPEGCSLHYLKIQEFDPKYGGRWNAGSNRRGGGTELTPQAYAEELARRFANLPKSLIAAPRE